MKRGKAIFLFIVAVLIILFTPIPTGVYKDGGTRTYTALTYKIVKWNRLSGEAGDVYSKTSTYWAPDNFKSVDELWEMEINPDAVSSSDS